MGSTDERVQKRFRKGSEEVQRGFKVQRAFREFREGSRFRTVQRLPRCWKVYADSGRLATTRKAPGSGNGPVEEQLGSPLALRS